MQPLEATAREFLSALPFLAYQSREGAFAPYCRPKYGGVGKGLLQRAKRGMSVSFRLCSVW